MSLNTDEYWQDAAHHTGDVVPFLIHSLTNHYELIADVIRHTTPRNVVEIGSEAGGLSVQLASLSQELGFVCTTIDPQPDKKLTALAARLKTYTVITGKSLDHIEALPFFPEVAIIDGDHNYYTVFNELTKLLAKRAGAFAIILHDVGFPAGRRDMYYNPADIPKQYLRPHSFYDGALPGVKRLVKNAGFSGDGSAALAVEEGGPKNGVLTAVEDVLAHHKNLHYQQIEAVFGLGVLFGGPEGFVAAIKRIMAPYQRQILTNMERNRLANYMRLIELNRATSRLQQENATHQAALSQTRAELAAIQRELELLKASNFYRAYRRLKRGRI